MTKLSPAAGKPSLSITTFPYPPFVIWICCHRLGGVVDIVFTDGRPTSSGSGSMMIIWKSQRILYHHRCQCEMDLYSEIGKWFRFGATSWLGSSCPLLLLPPPPPIHLPHCTVDDYITTEVVGPDRNKSRRRWMTGWPRFPIVPPSFIVKSFWTALENN